MPLLGIHVVLQPSILSTLSQVVVTAADRASRELSYPTSYGSGELSVHILARPWLVQAWPVLMLPSLLLPFPPHLISSGSVIPSPKLIPAEPRKAGLSSKSELLVDSSP